MSVKLDASGTVSIGYICKDKSNERYFANIHLEFSNSSKIYELPDVPIKKEEFDSLKQQIDSSDNKFAKVGFKGELELKLLEPTIN